MNLVLSFFSIFLIVSHANANPVTPQNAEEFCKRVQDPSIVMDLATDTQNLTGFDNNGGLFDGGTCWWHSRLQRSALYLTVFRPDLPAPRTKAEVNRIFRDLQENKRVVEIGGFSNWQSFSAKWQNVLQKDLNGWQLSDAFIRQAWVNGLLNRTRLSSEKSADRLKKLIQKIIVEVKNQQQIAYVKLPMKGLTAHAWLVVDASPTSDGVDLSILDSNFSSPGNGIAHIPLVYHYHDGDQSFDMENTDGLSSVERGDVSADYGNFDPFVQHQGDFKKINRAISDYCAP